MAKDDEAYNQGLQDGQLEQQQQNLYQTPISSINPTVLLLTNPQDLLHDFEMQIRGLSYDNNGNLIQTGEPLLNLIGVKSIITLIQSHCHQIHILTSYRPEVIPKLQMNLVRSMELLLGTRWHEFGMNPYTRSVMRTYISTAAIGYTYPAMLRGENEGERRFIKGTTQEIITNQQQQQQRKSLIGKITGWR